ncbi:hypothetical protein [Wansuia hejianensis]|uniref:Uncharacterized protein n=1 Tax=Wansuia hejianensis TaxID=2763667 RepID=A0A926ILN0_9FIRM|nr:hypothetical protein [Wansuia hejianensis]MBC8589545.1 hypothetical protein [Wansuia hejianensis]
MNNQVILILLLYLSMNKDNSEEVDNRPYFSSYIQSMEIDPDYTEKKIHIAKKIAPFLPTEYLGPYEKSIIITESIVKILELKKHINNSYKLDIEPLDFENNRERLNKIVTTVQKEIPKSNMSNLGIVIDLIVNMDKYKQMFNLLNHFTNTSNIHKDSTNMMKLMEPLLKEMKKDDKSSMDIDQIMKIMSTLNKPKITKKENQPNEG